MIVYVKEFQVPCGVLLIGSCEGNLVMSDWRDGWHCASVQKRLERYFKGPFVEGMRILICVNGVLKHVNTPDSYLRERCANIVDSVRSLA